MLPDGAVDSPFPELVMSLRSFLDEIVQPNMQLALENPEDRRHAFNAVLAVDSLAGHIFVSMKSGGAPEVDALRSDDEYRDALAAVHDDFRAIRDLAATYKHGELTNPKRKQPRRVSRPNQVVSVPNQCGIFQAGDMVGGQVLVLTYTDGGGARASSAIGSAYRLMAGIVDRLEPMACVDIPECETGPVAQAVPLDPRRGA